MSPLLNEDLNAAHDNQAHPEVHNSTTQSLVLWSWWCSSQLKQPHDTRVIDHRPQTLDKIGRIKHGVISKQSSIGIGLFQ